MHQFPTEETVLQILQNSILAVLVIRVLVTKLFRKYPCFFGFLLVACLQALVLPFVPYDSVSYRYCWLITQALLTCFCALIVLELYGLILSDLTGLASTSRRYLKISIGVAILISLLLLLVEKTPHNLYTGFMVFDRAIVTSLLIFVLLLTAFLVYYPIPINRNLVVYSIGYAVYFLPKGSGLLAVNVSNTGYRLFGIAVVIASTVSMLFWLIGLSRRGEEKTMVIGHRWNREDRNKVLERLKAINASLLRAGRQ
jgi:hypothetical protein